MNWYEDLKKAIDAITPGYINYYNIDGICVISDAYKDEYLHIEINARSIEGERTHLVTRIQIIKEFRESEDYQEYLKREAMERYKEMIIKIIIWCNERSRKL